jgi:hypothetical protein
VCWSIACRISAGRAANSFVNIFIGSLRCGRKVLRGQTILFKTILRGWIAPGKLIIELATDIESRPQDALPIPWSPTYQSNSMLTSA